jgi:hypothetical protein
VTVYPAQLRDRCKYRKGASNERVTLVFLFLAFCALAFASESQLQKATNVLNESMGAPDKRIPDELFE